MGEITCASAPSWVRAVTRLLRFQQTSATVRKFSPAIIVLARPGSKWSIHGHRAALERLPTGGKCSGTTWACISMIMAIASCRGGLGLPRARGPERDLQDDVAVVENVLP